MILFLRFLTTTKKLLNTKQELGILYSLMYCNVLLNGTYLENLLTPQSGYDALSQ